MALKINGSRMKLYIQCTDDFGNIGCFMRDQDGKQFGNTYKDTYSLFKGHDYLFCKAHEIQVEI